MMEDDARTVLQRLDTALALVGDYWRTLRDGDETLHRLNRCLAAA